MPEDQFQPVPCATEPRGDRRIRRQRLFVIGAERHQHFLVDEKEIEPHIPVIDKSKRDEGTFSREDFTYDHERDRYVCPTGKILPRSNRKRKSRGDDMISYFSRAADCRSCLLKSRCCP